MGHCNQGYRICKIIEIVIGIEIDGIGIEAFPIDFDSKILFYH